MLPIIPIPAIVRVNYNSADPVDTSFQKNFAEAEKLHERIQLILEKEVGPDHVLVAQALKERVDMLWRLVRAA